MKYPDFITLNGAYEMELNYMKEHTSCVNYKTKEYEAFHWDKPERGRVSTIRSRR